MNGTVTTVRGPVPVTELGLTLTHEHLLADRVHVTGNTDHVVVDEALAVEELRAFADRGGRTLVDLTTSGFGRDPAALQRISEATGVNVVMGSGWYLEAYTPDELDRRSVDELADGLVAEFETGVGDTGVRPGIIGEVASGRWISAREERAFRACARAQRRVGVPVSTHAFRWPVGTDQLDLLLEEGVDPAKVVIGHSDSVPDPEYHEALAAKGAWVQFDLLRARADWDVRRSCRLIAEFFRRGHAGRALLSQDVCMKSHLRAYGGRGYVALFETYLPVLAEEGVPEEVVLEVLTANPARLFSES